MVPEGPDCNLREVKAARDIIREGEGEVLMKKTVSFLDYQAIEETITLT